MANINVNDVAIGSIYEIAPAYEMDTGYRTGYDEIAGCAAEVLKINRDGTVDVWINRIGEMNVWHERLIRKPLR